MLYVLILLALLVLSVAVWALFWAIRNKQFDNLESQAWNVVLDDDTRPPARNDQSDSDHGDKENHP